MKEWTGGSRIVMKGTPRVPSYRPLMVVGYKCRSQKVLVFIDTEEARSTKPGVPCLSCYPDNYSNVSILPVLCPSVIGRYISAFNEI